MSRELSESGQVTGLVLVGLIVLAIPAGLALAKGLATSPTPMDTAKVITPTLPPVNLTATPTPTPTPSPTHEGSTNDPGGNATNGQTHFVNSGAGIADGVTPVEGCSNANYTTVQAAVDAAEPGDTVAVCPGTYSEHVKVTTANLTLTAADRFTQTAGDVIITNANESAVWINSSSVTVQGFNIRVGDRADYAIEVGGEKSVIKNNVVDAPVVGIFLSDGHIETGECLIGKGNRSNDNNECDHSPPVDPELGPARKGHVLDNTVSSGNYGIWVDADRTVVRNNFLTDREPDTQGLSSRQAAHPGISFIADHEDTIFLCQGCKYHNTTLISSGNDTVIRGNTVKDENTESTWYYHQAGIQVGKTPWEGHNVATNNTVAGNFVEKPFGEGIRTRMRTAGTLIRNNTITASFTGVLVYDGATISNNRITPASENCDFGREGIQVTSFWFHAQKYERFGEDWHEGKVAVIKNNTLDGGKCFIRGVESYGNMKVIGNTIQNFLSYGIQFNICKGSEGKVLNNKIVGQGGLGGHAIEFRLHEGRGPRCEPGWQNYQVEILNNKLTDNQNGVHIMEDTKPRQIEIHGNLINNNEDLGINNENASVIVDATNNIWACGGPSGGANPLADPYTGRLADGRGDIISGGNGSTRNGHPISNVHFDPFRIQNPSSCPEPQPTPTSTSTPTPTPTPTKTATPSPTAAAGIGNGTGGSGGNGTGGVGGQGTGGKGSGVETSGGIGPSGETATPPRTPTLTETPPPTPTISPTPRVEPGFGVVTWTVGIAILVSFVALRRRTGLRWRT